jgi:hypothetical protein
MTPLKGPVLVATDLTPAADEALRQAEMMALAKPMNKAVSASRVPRVAR